MSPRRRRNRNDDDRKPGVIYKKQLHIGRVRGELTVSRDTIQNLRRRSTWIRGPKLIKRPTSTLASAHVSLGNAIEIIEKFDREPHAGAEGFYARAGVSENQLIDKPGERLPKLKAYAEAGVGHAHAEFSVFEAQAKGPNASACVEASVSMLGAGAMARAEIASVSANAGPVGVKLGLGIDTGASIGLTGAEAKVLGTGVSAGEKTSVSVMNSEVSCSVM